MKRILIVLAVLIAVSTNALGQAESNQKNPNSPDVARLIEDLHGDPLASQNAKKALLKLGATAVPQLADAMANFKGWGGQDGMTRVQEVLAEIGLPAVGPVDEILRGVRGNGSNGLRGSAARVLGETRRAEAVVPLARSLSGSHKDDHFVVSPILKALGKIGGPDAVGAIISRFDDKDRDIRRTAAEELVRLKWEPPNDLSRIKLLCEVQDWDGLVKAKLTSAAIDYLESLDATNSIYYPCYDTTRALVGIAKVAETDRAVGVLARLLKKGKSGCQELSADALKELWPGSRAAVPELIDALRNGNANASWITEKDAAQSLLTQADRIAGLIEDIHGDQLASQNAKKALLKLGATAVPQLADAMANFKGWGGQDGMTRVGEVLAEIGLPAIGLVDEILRGVRGNGSNGLRGRAAQVLGETRRAEAVAPLARSLSGSHKDDHFVVSPILKALGKIGGPDAVGAIISRFDDKDRDIRRTAAEELVRLKWEPPNDLSRIKLFCEVQDWDGLVKAKLTSAAIDYIEERLRTADRGVSDAGIDYSWGYYYDSIRALVGIGKVVETDRAVGVLARLLKNKNRECQELSADALKELWPGSRAAIPELIDALRNGNAKAFWITEKNAQSKAAGLAAILDGLMANPSKAPAIKRAMFEQSSNFTIKGLEAILPDRQRKLLLLLYHTRQSIPAGMTDHWLMVQVHEEDGKRPAIDEVRKLFKSPSVLELVPFLENLPPENLHKVVQCITAVWSSGNNPHGVGISWAAASLGGVTISIRLIELVKIAPVVRLLADAGRIKIPSETTAHFQWSKAPSETIGLPLAPWGERDRAALERLARSPFELYSSMAKKALQHLDRSVK